MKYGPVRVHGMAEGRLWYQTKDSPVDDGPPSIVAIDLLGRTAQACSLDDIGPFGTGFLDVTVDGLLVPIQNTDPAAPSMHQIVPFKAILEQMKNPRIRPGIARQDLQDGVAYAAVPFVERPSHGDGLLHVVRIDPRRASVLAFTSVSEHTKPQSAAQWSTNRKLAVVINAGMYEPDHLTHTGYFRVEGQTNSAQWIPSYKSALLLPGHAAEASAQIIDLDNEDSSSLMKREGAVAQNLRLIRAPGINVWPENQKRWS